MSQPATGRPVAMVTGASAGIGAAYAAALARDGYDLVLLARRRERLEALAAELRRRHGGQVECLTTDLSDETGIRSAERRIQGDPEIDLLVNNAGRGSFGPLWQADPPTQSEVSMLNAVAPLRLSRAALGRFVPRRSGALVLVSSLNGYAPSPYAATYGATKAFVNSLAHALREELRGTGVQVQLLCPGFTRTEFQDRAAVPKEAVPSFAWTGAEAVVESSLEALRRDRFLCVPGRFSKALGLAMRAAPTVVVRRVSAWLAKPLL